MIITACICTHNREKYLAAALDSLCHQSLPQKDYEILVIDNLSTDSTAKIINTYQVKYPSLIRSVTEKKLGLSHARNRALKEAKGKYVCFLDDDARACQDWLKAFLQVFKKFPHAIAVGGRIDVVWEGRDGPPEYIPPKALVYYGGFDLGNKVKEHDYVPGGNGAWNVVEIKKFGGFNTKLGRKGDNGAGCEESLLNRRLKEKNLKMYYSPFAQMDHYIGPTRQSPRYVVKRCMGQQYSGVILVSHLFESSRLAKGGQLVKLFISLIKEGINKFPQLLSFLYKPTLNNTQAVCDLAEIVGRIHGTIYVLRSNK